MTPVDYYRPDLETHGYLVMLRCALAEIGLTIIDHPNGGFVVEQGITPETDAAVCKATNLVRASLGAPTFPDVATYLKYCAWRSWEADFGSRIWEDR